MTLLKKIRMEKNHI